MLNPKLKIYLYRNQLQLSTPDAFYSDGNRYRPAAVAAAKLKSFLPGIKSVLALGTGLGSIARVLHKKGIRPHYTLVEYDKVILEWAIECFDVSMLSHIDPVCADAALFMQQNRKKFDLIFIDVFIGRFVPDFVTALPFLQMCREATAPGGKTVLNYIVNNPYQWEEALKNFQTVFPGCSITSIDINRILIS